MLSSPELGSPHDPAAEGGKNDPRGGVSAEASTAHAVKHIAAYERHLANKKAWREKNKERIKLYMEKYWAQNPHKKRAYKYANKRRVKTTELVGLMAAQGGACALCGDSIAKERHLDHKTPRSRGGADEIANYQFLCPTCNAAKGVLTNDEFLAHIRKILARGAQSVK